MAKFIQPSPQEWIDPKTGVRLILSVSATPPVGDPRNVTVQCSANGAMEIAYDCGCVWIVGDGPARVGRVGGLPDVCPNHDPAYYAPGQVDQRIRDALAVANFPPAVTSMWRANSSSIRVSSVAALQQPGPRPELELSFDTEPIVGWRMWRIVDFHRHGGVTEPRLAPLTERAPWQPRERVTAVCDSHEAPWRDCMCGIWALRDEQAAIEKALQHGRVAFGEVYLWGRVMEFEQGWRGRYAYPKRISVVCSDRDFIDVTGFGSKARNYTPGSLIADYAAHLETQESVAAELARIYGVPADVWQPPELPDVPRPVDGRHRVLAAGQLFQMHTSAQVFREAMEKAATQMGASVEKAAKGIATLNAQLVEADRRASQHVAEMLTRKRHRLDGLRKQPKRLI